MKTITLTSIAQYLGVSIPFLCEVVHDKKRFSSKRARDISAMTGIPLEQLLFADGDKILQSLRVAYTVQRQSKIARQDPQAASAEAKRLSRAYTKQRSGRG